jgi:GNAT superfamily N-acetyltransferase
MTSSPRISIRALQPDDTASALSVINAAARWYAEFLPPDELHGEEMTPAQFEAEAVRLTWYGAFADAQLVAVMGLEPRDAAVALIRHGYVLPSHQRSGIGTALLMRLEREAGVPRILIGTYAANHKARSSLEKAGYRLCPDPASVLAAHFAIDAARAAASVAYEKRLG